MDGALQPSSSLAIDQVAARRGRRELRPWGYFECLELGQRFQVKRLSVNPGARLSLQKHHHRAEHWVVVQGTAFVTCGTESRLVSESQSVYIPIGEIHRVANPGRLQLELIEVQCGAYLHEDDIVRLEDDHGRVSPGRVEAPPPAEPTLFERAGVPPAWR